MRNIENFDVNKINMNGKYIDLSNNIMFDLTDEEIVTLRKLYHNSSIAENRVVRKDSVSSEGKKKTYRLTREQSYNRGCKTKSSIKQDFGKVVLVGGLVTAICISGYLFDKKSAPKFDTSHDKEIYAEIKDVDQALFISQEENGLNNSNIDNGAIILEKLNDNNQDETIIQENQVNISNSLKNAEEMTEGTVSDGSNYVNDEVNENVSEEQVYKENDLDTREGYIHYLCNVYQVNYDIVYSWIVQLTDNFMSDDYLNGCIEGITCKGQTAQANSEKELLFYMVRCIKQLPERYLSSTEGLYIQNGYTSGNNYNEQIKRIADILGLDKIVMYAIVNAETSFDSPLFINANNPAGMKDSDTGEWNTFATKEEGFFELGTELLKYYKMAGITPDQIDRNALSKIRDIHCPLSDNVEDEVNNYWLDNVMDGIEKAQMREVELFGSEEENHRLSF